MVKHFITVRKDNLVFPGGRQWPRICLPMQERQRSILESGRSFDIVGAGNINALQHSYQGKSWTEPERLQSMELQRIRHK